MAVLSMMRIPGDPDELAAKMREHLAGAAELAQKHGGLANFVARDGENGLLVVNVWESEEGRHAMAEEPEIQEGLRAAGFPPPAFEGYELFAWTFAEGAASGSA
jgi:hypothetical protein